MGLLWSTRTLECGGTMQIRPRNSSNGTKSWRFTKKVCRKEVVIHNGTWFEDSKLTNKEIFQLSYFWFRQIHTQQKMQFDILRL